MPPWDKYQSGASDSSGPWAKYGAVAKSEPTSFPFDDPNKSYGSVLPFAEDIKTGKLELAFPEAIRAPLRGMITGGQKILGERPVDSKAPVSPDELAATMAAGGMRVAPGSGSFGPATAQGRAIPPGYNILRDRGPNDPLPIPENYDPARDVERPTYRGSATTLEKQTIPENYDIMADKVAPSKPGMKLTARDAIQSGYVLPPQMINDQMPLTTRLASAWAGKVKQRQDASIRNQANTNRLAAQELGLPEGAAITKPALEAVRAKAGQAYDAVRKAVPTIYADQDYSNAIRNLADRNSAAAKEFPGLFNDAEIENLVGELGKKGQMSSEAALDLVRKLRKDASANFRNRDKPEKANVAFAQRQAADALDGLIERNILQEEARQRFDPRVGLYLNKPDPALKTIARDYHEARTLIAKSHNIEDALIGGTDDIAASRIAALEDRGAPLTGGLKTIADAYHAFKPAMQAPEKFGGAEDYSVLDAVVAGEALAKGKLGLVGAVLGRPIARHIQLRPNAQRNYIAPPITRPPSAVRLMITPPNVTDAINPPVPTP